MKLLNRARTPVVDTPSEPINAYAGAKHLLATSDGVWAHYALHGVDWYGTGSDTRGRVRRAQAARWAELCGHRVRVRQSSSPFDHYAWAERVDKAHPPPGVDPHRGFVTHRLPDRDGAPSFGDVLTSGQVFTADTGRRKSAAVLAVRVTTRVLPRGSAAEDLIHLLADRPGTHRRPQQLEEARQERAKVDAAVGKDGFGGVPVSANSVAWLIHASLGMGAPVPPVLVDYPGRESWDHAQVPGFTNPVRATIEPYRLTTTLHVARDGESLTRHVAVLTADRFQERDEDADPFLAWTLGYPLPLEVVGQFDVVDGAGLKRAAEKARKRAREVEAHHREHDEDPPREVARGIDLALGMEDEFQHGDTPTRTRLIGSWLVAVTGETEQEALEAARHVGHAAEEDQGVTLTHDYGQYRAWRAFTPGEPWPDTGGHVTQVPARYAAAALVPNVSVEAGDPTGCLIGPVTGGHDVMVLDPFGGSRRNLSGVSLMCGNQGAGKSALAGLLTWWTARLGVRTVAVDPAGLWRAVTQLPDLRRDAHYLDVAAASRGALVPSVMIPEPRLDDYNRNEDLWREARATAAAERVELMVDTLSGLLPWDYRQEVRKLTSVLQTSCASVGGAYGEDPWAYVADLRDHRGEVGREVAEIITARADYRGGALIFPERGRDVRPERAAGLLDRATLTVISTHGLPLPPKGISDRGLWTPAQQDTVPVLGLVARLATLAMYTDRANPTNVTIDELGLVATAGSSFPSFVNRVAVDSRKWYAFVNLLFQSPAMVNAVDENIGNLSGSAWVGRLDTRDAKQARGMLRDDDPDSGLEARVADQTAGQFHVRDWLGRRRRVYVDQSWWPVELLTALDTTPGERGAYDDKRASLFGVPA